MSEHTPGPWRLSKNYHILSDDGSIIADIHETESNNIAANAEFILRACNCHEELLEALEIAAALATAWVAYYTTSPTYGNGTEHLTHTVALIKISDTIAKAKGSSHE